MGSVSRITEQIGQLVVQNNWNSYIAYGREAGESNSKLIKIGNKRSVYLHYFYSLLFDKHGLGSVKVTKKFISEIIRIKPDLIHLHNIHGFYLNYELLFNFLSTYNVPIVWTLHDCWSITGHCSHFVSASCNKWKTECFDCPLLSDYPRSLFVDNSKNNYLRKQKQFSLINKLTLVPVSDWLAGILKESFLGHSAINRIYNGINTEVFFPRDDLKETRIMLGCENKMILLGVATSWGKSKGLFDYYELQNRLKEDEQIVLVGLTEKQIKDLPNNIIGLKRTYNLDSLATLYSAADIVLNLSIAESFGLTTIEGMSCGTPGIVYNCTASPELVTEKTGFVVEPGNFDSLLACIKTVKDRGKEFYTNSCRNRVLTYFKKEDRYQEYIALYKRLLKM